MMTRYDTLTPCVVCGGKLEEVTAGESINQPHQGLAFTTHGTYGSEAFDPMNGEYLEVLICDSCIQRAALKKQVVIGRERKPVTVDGMMIGWTAAHRELVLWDKDMEDDNEDLTIDSEDEWEACKDRIDLLPSLPKDFNPFPGGMFSDS